MQAVQAAATSAVLVLSVIAVLVIVLALVLYVRKLRAYQSDDKRLGPEPVDAHALRTRTASSRAARSRR